MQLSERMRRIAAVGTAAVALGALAVVLVPAAGFAAGPGGGSTADDGAARHARLTDEQRECLREQGVTRREVRARRFRVPTDEERQAMRDAAAACGIELPDPPEPLTDEQRACLEEHGVTPPEPGSVRPRLLPRDERQGRVEELRGAAEACGIELPLRGGRGCDHPDEGTSDPASDATSASLRAAV
jgi:hypothetical protein